MSDNSVSQMIRVPSPLVDAVRELARLHRAGRTKAVLQGVQRLIAAIDSDTAIDIDSFAETISNLTGRLERLESEQTDSKQDIDVASITQPLSERLKKVEADIESLALTLADLNVRLSDLEGVGDVSTDTETTADVGQQGDIADDSGLIAKSESSLLPVSPLNQSTLAKRLGCSDKTIEKHRKQGSKEQFAAWSRDRDPAGIAWTWKGQGGRGQPLWFSPVI